MFPVISGGNLYDFYQTFRSIHPDAITCFETIGGIATTHHSRDTQFTRNNGSMGKRCTNIGDYRGGTRKEQSPGDICLYGNQDFTRLKVIPVRWAFNDANNSFHYSSGTG